LEELDAEIQQTTSELKMNESLAKDIGSKTTSVENPLQIKINSLKLQKEKHMQAMNIKIEDAEQEGRSSLQMLQNQIGLLQNELKLLEEEKLKLNKYATTDGVVQNVYVKAGEQVDSFAPLVELNPLHPTTIAVYLIGKKNSMYPIGSSVQVIAYDQQRTSIEGKVIGYGSVRELPEILQKSTAVKAFGQEVFIEIPADNTLSNGEKVLVR
jgi:HlyD family secretion protein